MEANMQVLEGAQYRMRVKLTNKAGEQLPPEFFRVYAGAFCPGCAPAHFHAERTADEWVLTMPGLKPGRVPWNWQLLAAEYATGVEWLLAAGEVTVTPRHATGSGCVDPGELKIVATLDKTTLQMTVEIGESTAACSLAVVAAQNSAKEAANSAELATEQAQAAETARKQADGSATNAAASAADAHEQATAADTSATDAANSARDAAASSKAAAAEVQKAAAEVEKAKLERETAATHATAAAQSAQDALANQQASEQAAQDAALAQVAAETAKADADAAKLAAQTADQNAKASADAAAADKAAAEQAKNDALAAQTTAEEQADIAKLAAEEAQAPESLAVQAARPATMVLLKDELLSLLGDASLFDIDTDGQKIIVHTDRLSDEQLTTVTDMLERFVPGFLEVTRYNHHIEYTYAEYMKYSTCRNSDDVLRINRDFENDLTPSGVQAFNFDKATSFGGWSSVLGANYYPWYNNAGIRKLYLSFPSITYLVSTIGRECPNLEEVELFANAANAQRIGNNCPELRRARVILPFAKDIRDILTGVPKLEECEFQADWENVTCIQAVMNNAAAPQRWVWPLPKCKSILWGLCGSSLTSFEVDLPALQQGYDAFLYATLDVASVVRICNSIPTVVLDTSQKYGDGRLGLGIHIDYEGNTEVIDAIETAKAKGWDVKVRYNGTTTAASSASAFAIRRVIYARLDERPDGETVLSWAHYVTDETGYETFRSMESAYEYFGLPIPDEESFS